MKFETTRADVWEVMNALSLMTKTPLLPSLLPWKIPE